MIPVFLLPVLLPLTNSASVVTHAVSCVVLELLSSFTWRASTEAEIGGASIFPAGDDFVAKTEKDKENKEN